VPRPDGRHGRAREHIVVVDSKASCTPAAQVSTRPSSATPARRTPVRSPTPCGGPTSSSAAPPPACSPRDGGDDGRAADHLALANPEPEIRPELAKQARPDCIVATGRSDYPNQVNNVLCFPYIFRGALDAGATSITDAMKLACVREIAAIARRR